jgi:hypothetical protein
VPGVVLVILVEIRSYFVIGPACGILQRSQDQRPASAPVSVLPTVA